MKLNVLENENVKLAFLSAIGEDYKLIEKVVANKKSEDNNEYEVEFKVNGVELNFQNFIDKLVDSYDECTKGDARRFVMNEMQDNIDDRINNAIDSLQDAVSEIRENAEELRSNVNNRLETQIEELYKMK